MVSECSLAAPSQQPSLAWPVVVLVVVCAAMWSTAQDLASSWETLTAAVPKLGSWLFPSSCDKRSAYDLRVANGLEAARLQAMVCAASHIRLIACMGMLTILMFNANFLAWLGMEESRRFVKDTFFCGLLLGYLVLKHFMSDAKRLKGKDLKVYGIIGSWMALRSFHFQNTASLIQALPFRINVRCLLAVLFADARGTLFVNTVICIADSAAFCLKWRSDITTFEGTPWTFVTREIFTLLLAVTLSVLMESYMEQHVRASLASESDALAVNSLVSSLSDGVVRLDKNLFITNLSPNLANTLRCVDDLSGKLFTDLFATAEDKISFETHIASVRTDDLTSTNALPCSTALHATLKHISGSHIPVRLFHAGLVTADGSLSHIVAVCHSLSETSAGLQEAQELERLGIAECDLDCAAALQFAMEQATQCSQQQRSVSKGSVARPGHWPDKRARASFDALSLEFTIVDCTSAWIEICGDVDDLEAFAGSDLVAEIQSWLQLEVNRAIDGKWCQDEFQHPNFAQVTVGRADADTVYKASVSLMLPDPLVGYNADEATYLGVVSLDNVQLIRIEQGVSGVRESDFPQ